MGNAEVRRLVARGGRWGRHRRRGRATAAAADTLLKLTGRVMNGDMILDDT